MVEDLRAWQGPRFALLHFALSVLAQSLAVSELTWIQHTELLEFRTAPVAACCDARPEAHLFNLPVEKLPPGQSPRRHLCLVEGSTATRSIGFHYPASFKGGLSRKLPAISKPFASRGIDQLSPNFAGSVSISRNGGNKKCIVEIMIPRTSRIA